MSYYPDAQKRYRSKKGYSAMSRARQIGRQTRNTKFIVDYLSTHPCSRCGYNNMLALEFHHRNPKTKIRSISAMFHNGDALKTLAKEIKKCDVLCANCHKIEHASEIRKQAVEEFLARP